MIIGSEVGLPKKRKKKKSLAVPIGSHLGARKNEAKPLAMSTHHEMNRTKIPKKERDSLDDPSQERSKYSTPVKPSTPPLQQLEHVPSACLEIYWVQTGKRFYGEELKGSAKKKRKEKQAKVARRCDKQTGRA